MPNQAQLEFCVLVLEALVTLLRQQVAELQEAGARHQSPPIFERTARVPSPEGSTSLLSSLLSSSDEPERAPLQGHPSVDAALIEPVPGSAPPANPPTAIRRSRDGREMARSPIVVGSSPAPVEIIDLTGSDDEVVLAPPAKRTKPNPRVK